jgi:hypothetical protein
LRNGANFAAKDHKDRTKKGNSIFLLALSPGGIARFRESITMDGTHKTDMNRIPSLMVLSVSCHPWSSAYGCDSAVKKFLRRGFGSVNELTAGTNGGKLTVMGTTPSIATNVAVNGTNALLYGDATFAATNMPLTTTRTAIAKDAYGRVNTNTAIAARVRLGTSKSAKAPVHEWVQQAAGTTSTRTIRRK